MASIFRVPADGGSCLTVILRDVSAEESLRAQLLQSQKMDAVGRLAGGIAHDFNNLLTVILGTGSLLKERFARDPEVQADLGDITGAATRAAELTGQLLAFSRRQVLAPRRLDVNELVRDTCRMLGRVVGEHITLRLDLAPDVGVVEADPGQLEQALLNLAINARDAMPEGGTLTIETANAGLDDAWERDLPPSPGGRYTMVAVSDTGEGLTPEAREHLFEPFFTTKPAGQGTGLGLAMVYGIVKQSGGTIFPYSAPGHGTTFKIYLPQVAGPAEAVFPEAAAEPATRGTETVLVVEDAEPVRLLVARVLGEAGYTVLSAPNGEEALALARRHPGPLHLLVTDIVMPGMSGTALAGALTAERAGMAVLYLSGYTGDAILGSGLLSEGVHFLSKPFSPADLARKVRGVLDGKRAAP